jgi:hypothetical protein
MRSGPVIASFVRLAALLACSCSQAEPSGTGTAREPLVAFGDWTSVAHSDDPLVTASDLPECVEPTFRAEDDQQWVEVDTTLCNWVTLSQPARAAVAVGDELELDFSHYDLTAAASASAELRLRFGACEAWSKSIPIPSPAEVYREQFHSPCGLAQGDNVLFHLHNHGQNTYQLKDLLK